MQSGPSQSSLLTSSPISPRGLPEAIPFQGLELGYVLGRGAFGSVFQGTYNGRPVAVKVRPAPSLYAQDLPALSWASRSCADRDQSGFCRTSNAVLTERVRHTSCLEVSAQLTRLQCALISAGKVRTKC